MNPLSARSRRFLAPLLILALLQSQLLAATKTWIGNAAAVKQITTCTVANTWLTTETATWTINGKSVVVTLVGDESTGNVAIALKEAWMNPVRLDGTGTTDATSNAGGQEFGEYTEVTATVSGSVITLTGNTPGVPFTVTVGETSASGTLTLATPQAATGPHHWDNAKNWDTGTVPANDDTVVFRDNDVPCRYNLPQAGVSAIEVEGEIHNTYTGEIGLRKINRSNPSKPYSEYRTPLRVELDYTGTSSTLTHRLGIGPGQGSRLIKWYHEGDAGLTVSAIVYNTNSASEDSERPLQLTVDNSTAVGAVTIHNGIVELGNHDASGAPMLAVASVKVVGGDVLMRGNFVAFTLDQAGGNVELAASSLLNGNSTLKLTGGQLISRTRSSAGTLTATVENSTMVWSCDETIDTLEVRNGGVVDGEQDLSAVTITNCDLYEGASLLFGNGRALTTTNGIDLNRTDLDGVKLRIGTNKRLTQAAVP